MFNKNKKDENHKKKGWLFWAMLGFYFLKKIFHIKSKENFPKASL